MKLSEYTFGFADAEKEYSRLPQIFTTAFFDSRNVVSKLINEYHFLLIGRKGVGKSAFSAKIQSLSSIQQNLFAVPVKLNDFEFSTFSKTSIDSDVIGTQKYKASWDFIILLTIYKIIYNELSIDNNEGLNSMLVLLESLGFPLEQGYKKDITRLSKLKIGSNILNFDIEFEKEFGVKPNTYLERISSLNDRMTEILADVYFCNQKIVILIDGVDDILRFKKNQLEILSSLVRSVDYLNDKFFADKLPIKIVLFIREDIMNNITDPDLNKIKRDGAIVLNWYNRIDDLKSIVKLRFRLSGVPDDKIDGYWETIFPRKIRNEDSWSYILKYTLCKPRDILQFLKCCQEACGEKEGLSFSDIQNALKIYSRDYFIEEMKNEITGFIDDAFVTSLPSALQKLGTRSFTFNEFFKAIKAQIINKDITENDIKYLLSLLFEAGYMGQLYSNSRGGRESVIFKHRNTAAKVDFSQKFITHKGLYSGLGIAQ